MTTYQGEDRPYRHGFTAAHDRHSQLIRKEIDRRIEEKYKAGVEEHGGNLWNKTSDELLEDAIEETLDLLVYLMTLRLNTGDPMNIVMLMNEVKDNR